MYTRTVAIILAIAGIGLIFCLDRWLASRADLPKLERDISYGLLFLVGFLTGFHCVGMCGPLIVGYTTQDATAGRRSHVSHLLYGVGKTLSYTVIGGLFGALGDVIAFTPPMQSAVGVASGVFLILFGLHMLNLFPSLRRFHIRTPQFLMRFVGTEYRKHRNQPFVVGLLNGLMIICGPLQAMYVMAAGTGSAFDGAATLFFFGLGTLPLLLGFGFLASLLSTNLTPKLLKASGVIVVVLGAVMLNRGLALAGSGMAFDALAARVSQMLAPVAADTALSETEQMIRMEVLVGRYSPNQFTLRKGVPVKWVIDGKELNECNRSIVVPAYGLTFTLQPGQQTIEFTPTEPGVVPWSCSMGVIPGSFIVVDTPPSRETGGAATASAPFQQRVGQWIERGHQALLALWRYLDSR
ncbi:sulfite exporter TauE/SafE family protein [Methylolobus aquaticus]|nr:sulfite exporter TauE/SafE family protein [Methylolobus aquaticus]